MKFLLSALLLVSATSIPAYAETFCGLVGSRTVRPVCLPRRPCPHWIRLQYTLKLDSGENLDINASTSDVMTKFNELNQKQACVDGALQSNGSVLVDSISAR
jgi:hypothetical protein